MTFMLTTDSVAPRQRVAFWQDMICQSFVQAACGSKMGASFRGRLSTDDFGQSQITRIEAGIQRIDRRRTDIARCNRPRYYLCYQVTGRARVMSNHQESVIDPGEMVLLNNCEPYSLEYESEDVIGLVLQVPHPRLQERFRSPDRCLGRRMGGQRGLIRVMGEFLSSCAAQADSLADSQRVLTEQVALSLFSELLVEQSRGDRSIGTHQAILVARIKQFVLSKLADPSLTLEDVARGVGLSARYVSQLFQEDGDAFGRFLLRNRIEYCRRELANPCLNDLQISEIALRGGFNNLSHFSRVFRDRIGQSPTDYRAEQRR